MTRQNHDALNMCNIDQCMSHVTSKKQSDLRDEGSQRMRRRLKGPWFEVVTKDIMVFDWAEALSGCMAQLLQWLYPMSIQQMMVLSKST